MDKAIEALEALLEPDADDRIDWDDSSIICGKCGNKKWVYIAEALSDLAAYKAKTESLKDWVKAQKGVAKKTFDEEEYSQLNDRTYTIFETILQKLEELEQYHIKDKQCLS